jgi:hypothetical protein
MCEVLPPTSRDLSDSFVVVFGQSIEDLSKCQLLTVSRQEYKTLAQERIRVNSSFARTRLDEEMVDALPENGVPQQFAECAVQMPEVDRYSATRSGPGTIRDPLGAAHEDTDASDEISDVSSNAGHAEDKAREHSCNGEQPAHVTCDQQLNQFETALGCDPTSAPDFVQHVAAFKTQVELVQEAVKQMRSAAQPADTGPEHSTGLAGNAAQSATAQAAAEEECFRAVVDLREIAQKLDKHKFQEKAKLLDCVDNKALFVPSNKLLSMFNSSTWTQCFTEFWYGDALPNTSELKQKPKLTFEELFEALPDREELEYQLASDSTPYRARSQSRFDTPEHAIIPMYYRVDKSNRPASVCHFQGFWGLSRLSFSWYCFIYPCGR